MNPGSLFSVLSLQNTSLFLDYPGVYSVAGLQIEADEDPEELTDDEGQIFWRGFFFDTERVGISPRFLGAFVPGASCPQ